MITSNLTQRLVAGDETAFEELFRQFYFPMRAYACRFVHSMAVAEDIVQDVFSNLWATRSQIGSIQSLKAWLFMAVHNNATNYVKHKIVEEKYSQNLQFANITAEPMHQSFTAENADLYSQEMVHQIKKAIKILPEQTKRIFLLSRQYHLRNKDIAEFLNIDIKTVEKHISKALQHLRNMLGHYLHIFMLVIIKWLVG